MNLTSHQKNVKSDHTGFRIPPTSLAREKQLHPSQSKRNDLGVASTQQDIQHSVMSGCHQSLSDILNSVSQSSHKKGIVNGISQIGPAIIIAANFGNLECCKILIEHGANVNINLIGTKTSPKGTALFHAAVEQHEDVCTYLISKGADLNAVIQEEYNKTIRRRSLLTAIIEETHISKSIHSLLVNAGAE